MPETIDEFLEPLMIKKSILNVLSRIGEKEKTVSFPEFSNAINAVGEQFVDTLLQVPRTGDWWLDESGQFLKCTIRSVGKRVRRNFLPGNSPQWDDFWKTTDRPTLADALTGPDHVVEVTVPTVPTVLPKTHVVLEQKLRFGPSDANASGLTYISHLRDGLGQVGHKKYPAPNNKDFQLETYWDGLLYAAKELLRHTDGKGNLTYSGKVPHVCFVSVCIPDNRIYVCSNENDKRIECDYVGFLPPCINRKWFTMDSAARKIIIRAKVRLWLGLDSLLEKCEAKEVDDAWRAAIAGLTQNIRTPQCRRQTKPDK